MEGYKQLEEKGEITELHTTFFAGIRKVLYWAESGSFVAVEDAHGPNFSVPIPDELPEGTTPMHFFDHAMLYSPDAGQIKRGNIYTHTDK
jgi:hypothetical protein